MAWNIAESVIFLQLLNRDVIELSKVGKSFDVLNFTSFRDFRESDRITMWEKLQCEENSNAL